MSNMGHAHEESDATVSEAVSSVRGGGAATKPDEKPAHDVEVHVDYISADEPIHRKFSPETLLGAVKQWAREQFVPNPPSDKAYYLNDDKTRHRFISEEELHTLAQLGYEHSAHFRLNEEQASGT
jgi:hypothetical protein